MRLFLKMLEPKLYPHTVELLRNRPAKISLKEISEATNIKVRHLQSMMNDYNHCPKANTVEKLYIYLTGKPLNLES
jgi:hypothetical protein